MEKKNNMTGAKALIIMIASAATIFLGALVVKSPTVVNLIVAGLIAMFLAMIWGVKWDDIQNDILDLARRMFPAILVLIFVGHAHRSMDSQRNGSAPHLLGAQDTDP